MPKELRTLSDDQLEKITPSGVYTKNFGSDWERYVHATSYEYTGSTVQLMRAVSLARKNEDTLAAAAISPIFRPNIAKDPRAVSPGISKLESKFLQLPQITDSNAVIAARDGDLGKHEMVSHKERTKKRKRNQNYGRRKSKDFVEEENLLNYKNHFPEEQKTQPVFLAPIIDRHKNKEIKLNDRRKSQNLRRKSISTLEVKKDGGRSSPFHSIAMELGFGKKRCRGWNVLRKLLYSGAIRKWIRAKKVVV